jgi:hypothetical protein
VRAGPLLRRQRVEIERKAVLGRLIEEERLGSGQQRCPLVDLVEGIRTDHRRLRPRRIDHGLAEREQRLAGAVDRQHLRVRIQRLQAVATHEPRGDRLP